MATQFLPMKVPAGVNVDSSPFKLFAELERACRPLNVDSLRKCLHKDFRHVYLPRSIGEPERNKEEWVKHVADLLNSITVDDVTVDSATEAPGKIILHGSLLLKSSNGSITSEEVATLHIAADEDGSLKIKQIDEFRDSNTHVKWLVMAGITNK